MEKIQFNYDLWVNNKDKYDLVTRGGEPAKVYAKDPFNEVNHVLVGSRRGVMSAWDINGWFCRELDISNADLFMVEKKQTKTYKYIVVSVRYPKSGMCQIEACPLDKRAAIEANLIQEGFDYQIKEIEFEF